MGAAGPGGTREGGPGADSQEQGRGSVVPPSRAALGLKLREGASAGFQFCAFPSLSIFIFLSFGGGANFRSGWGLRKELSSSINVKPGGVSSLPCTGHQYCVEELIYLSVQAMNPFDMLL